MEYLQRARTCSALTVPSIMPPEATGSQTLADPFQSLGAIGVRNLAAKLLLTLLPVQSPFFKYTLSADVEAELKDTDSLDELIEAFALREKAIMSELETMGARPQIHESLLQLIVAGSVVLQLNKDKSKFKVYHLSNFVCQRDGEGDLLSLVTKEEVSPFKLPPEVLEIIRAEGAAATDEERLDLYTQIKATDGGKFEVFQEVSNHKFNTGTFTKKSMPYLALRWESQGGEDYGRSFCEAYLGDLQSLEGLRMSIVQGAAIAAQCKFIVHPNSQISIRKLAKAANGAIISGDPEAIKALQAGKSADLSVAAGVANDILAGLSQAFLLNSSVQRDAERVTASEISFIAEELQTALGGVYSLLTQELQAPLVRMIENSLVTRGKLKPIPGDDVSVNITTGLEALSRSHDATKWAAFLGMVRETLGPEVVERYLNPSVILKRLAVSVGVDLSDVIRTDEDLQASDQAAQQAAIGEVATPELVKQGGQIIQSRQAEQQQERQQQ